MAQSDNVIDMIDACIAEHEGKLQALHTTRALLLGGVSSPVPQDVKRLPAPEKQKRSKPKTDGETAADERVHNIEGVDVMVTEQQQAIIELLANSDYVPMSSILPIFDNNKTATQASLRNLSLRMVAARCPAVITPYKGRGFRLECPE